MLRRHNPTRALVASALLLSLAACAETPEPESAPVAEPAPIELPPSHPDCFGPEGRSRTLTFRRGDTLDGLLRQADLSGDLRMALTRSMAAAFDLGSFRTGRTLTLRWDRRGEFLSLEYGIDYLSDLCARRSSAEATGFRAEVIHAELDWRPRALVAEIDPSFYESLAAQGVSGDLATRVADLFAGEVDFFLDLRAGDTMEILVESGRRRDRPAAKTRVLAAKMHVGEQASMAYLFPDDRNRRHYYHRDGSSLERQFLKAPLNYSRISSGFSHRRRHPILGIHRPHYGVDYAAPMGTPVLATADGTVSVRANDGGAGRHLKVRHPGGIETTYMHLSRFARGTARGQRVAKGQVIGYVGSSGLSTGPHLDYRVKVNGSYVDPRSFRSDPASPLPEERRAAFDLVVARYDSLWSACAEGETSLAALDRQSSSDAASE